jgi:hypothetical protein
MADVISGVVGASVYKLDDSVYENGVKLQRQVDEGRRRRSG